MDAVILAGGRGTRLRPLTDTLPKPLVPFMGEPYAAGLLRWLQSVGVRRATFLVGRDTAPWAPLDALGRAVGIAVDVATEEQPLDTAGAARRLFMGGDRRGGPVLVCNGDILTDLDLGALLAAHRDAAATATIALTRVEDTSAFGVVVRDAAGRVERFVEKPEPGTVPDDTVNAGTYVLSPDAFDPFAGDGPLSFERAVFPGLVASGATVLGVAGDAHWADLGTPARYLAGHRAVLDGRCAWPVAPGMGPVASVTGPAPLARAHRSARIAADARIGPGTVIGEGCEVGAGATLADTVLHAGVVVGEGAVVTASILGPGVVVTAGAEVGPDAVLAAGVAVP